MERRDFLKTAAVAGIGATIAANAQTRPSNAPDQTPRITRHDLP